MVYPDVSKTWINIDRCPDIKARDDAYAVFERLAEIAELQGECATMEIPYLRFTEEAQQLLDDWRGKLEMHIRSGIDPPAIEAHLSKYRSLVPSLALVLLLVFCSIAYVRCATIILRQIL